MNTDNHLNDFIASLRAMYPSSKVNFSRPELVAAKGSNNKGFTAFIKNPKYKVSHGVYVLPVADESVAVAEEAEVEVEDCNPTLTVAMKADSVDSLVPQKNKEFVPFGDYKLIKNVINSKRFYPIYVTGESGNGKTEFCYQACAEENRQLVRANITSSTDEEDLIGGFRLINGETVWQNGPVTEAMLNGAVLLLDEVNLGTEKMMCLQPVLEGKAIFVKKINKYITPKTGFNVIATANTKGKGSLDGRYIGSQILNEAFLDRFGICIEHKYPTKKVELRILKNLLNKEDKKNDDTLEFANRLCEWADIIRKTFEVDGIDELITTRRLLHIMNFYLFAIPNRKKAIEYSINRFDNETKQSMISLYQKVDETIKIQEETNNEESDDEIAF